MAVVPSFYLTGCALCVCVCVSTCMFVLVKWSLKGMFVHCSSEKKGNEFCSRMKFLSVEFFFCHQLKRRRRLDFNWALIRRKWLTKQAFPLDKERLCSLFNEVSRSDFQAFPSLSLLRLDTVPAGNARSDDRDLNGTKIVSEVLFVGWYSDQLDEKMVREQIIRSNDWRSSERIVQQLIEVSQAMHLEDRWEAFCSFVRCRRFEANNPVACTCDE